MKNPFCLMVDAYDSEGYLIDTYTSYHSTEADARATVIPALNHADDSALNATVYIDNVETNNRVMQATSYALKRGIWGPHR